MSPRLRPIAALLLFIAVVGFCVSCHQHNTLITTFRAAQAAVAMGVTLAMAATALSELLPWPAWALLHEAWCCRKSPCRPKSALRFWSVE